MNMLLLGIVTGLDNLVVCTGMGTAKLTRRQIMVLIAAFAVAETLMTVVGFVVARHLSPEMFENLGPALLILAALIVLVRIGVGVSYELPTFLFALPLVMSLDNLAAGAGLGALGGFGIGAAVMAGLTAAALALTGLTLGRQIKTRTPALAHGLIALCILSVAAVDLVGRA